MFTNTSFQNISKDLFLQIGRYLEPQELVRCMRVSKLWNRLASLESLWKPLLEVCQRNKIQVEGGKVWTLMVVDPFKLHQKMVACVSKINFCEKIQFKCFFVHPEAQRLKINFVCEPSSLLHRIRKKRKRIETCIFVHTNEYRPSNLSKEGSSSFCNWEKGERLHNSIFTGLPVQHFDWFRNPVEHFDPNDETFCEFEVPRRLDYKSTCPIGEIWSSNYSDVRLPSSAIEVLQEVGEKRLKQLKQEFKTSTVAGVVALLAIASIAYLFLFKK